MKASSKLHRNTLRWSLILLAIIIAPAWAQQKKNDSKPAPQQHSAPQPHAAPAQHSAPPAQHPSGGSGGGGARPSPSGGAGGVHPGGAAGGGSNTGNRPAGTTGNAPKSAADTYKPAAGYGGAASKPPASTGGGNKPGATAGGGNRPGSTVAGGAGGNKPGSTVGGGNKPGTTAAGGAGLKGAGGAKPAVAAAKPFSPPKGAVAKPNARGGTTYTAKNGTAFHTGKAGNLTSMKTKSGAEARFGSNGKVAQIHSGNTTIYHGSRGGRVVESHLRGGGRVVSYGGHRGFVERPFNRGGRAYMRRSYYYGGRRYAAVYRGYYWHGNPYYGYVPGYYYGAGFYGWAYNPWVTPVSWGWGWGGSPWYGYYGYYFAPYPVYASPAFWLTDYLLAENLRASYEAQQAAAAANAQAQAEAAPPPAADSNAVVLTPEVKQAIADEVRAQIEAEKAAAASPNATAPVAAEANAAPAAAAPAAAAAPSGGDQLPDALNPKNRTFVVSNTLAEQTDDGTACSLSSGDVLTRIGDTPDANQSVKVLVTSSQNSDCATGTQVAVSVQDLQDMHNDFRQKMDSGLQSLADNQGKKGMPASPAPGKKAVPEGTAKPDDDADKQLDQADQNADKTEADVQQSQQEGSGDD